MNDRLADWLATPALVAAGLLGIGVLAACGDDTGGSASGADPSSPTAEADELGKHGGEVCPDELPLGSDKRHGLGLDEPADEAPSLPDPEEAWVCTYNHRDSATGGGGASYAWVRDGDARQVPADQIPTLADALTALTPADPGRMCTLELGPRLMLVYTHGSDLTGVVVDDFGCRDVRLTDEPFETAPGEATQPGTVPGVLSAPPALLAELEQLGQG